MTNGAGLAERRHATPHEPLDVDLSLVAEAAGLRYVSDQEPGIRRRRSGRGFSYRTPDGQTVDPDVRQRIESLAIPPAWTDVWICTDPDSHLLATGRDDRDRKQYVYHQGWREVRDEAKFDRLGEFGASLADLRRQVEADMATRQLTERRVLANVIRLLDTTLIRVGNERYAAENETFGATTLGPEHVRTASSNRQLCFTGKGGADWCVDVADRSLVRTIDACLALEQPQLFCFRGADGRIVDVTADQINARLYEIAGPCASAKTFRTWGGTVVALDALAERGDSTVGHDAAIIEAFDRAAEALGNTRAVCRACYVAPQIIAAFDDGRLAESWRSSRTGRWLSRAESATLKLLR